MKQSLTNWYLRRRVLVTGGAGFIGSHLVERLIALGAYVTVLDNFSSGIRDNLMFAFSEITLLDASITDVSACIQATRDQEVIFHCAALTSVSVSCADPLLYYHSNVMGTATILEAARCNNVRKFIFSSSAAVYGNYAIPCSEDMACKPLSPYGFSKLMAEHYCQLYARLYGIQTLSLRYFNVYGDRQYTQGSLASVAARFRYHMAHNLPITIYGDGSQRRDFVPVNDVVEATIYAAVVLSDCLAGQAINIATGTSVTLLEFIDSLKKEFPAYNQPINYASARTGDIWYSAADCSKYHMLIHNYG